nr:hypothetical protein [Paracoccus saliphilus]
MIRRHVIMAGAMAACAWLSFATIISGQTEATGLSPQPAAIPVVGDTPLPAQVRLIKNLGTFGLGPDLPGSRYAIVGKHLVRIDAESGQILSILRPLPELKD